MLKLEQFYYTKSKRVIMFLLHWQFSGLFYHYHSILSTIGKFTGILKTVGKNPSLRGFLLYIMYDNIIKNMQKLGLKLMDQYSTQEQIFHSGCSVQLVIRKNLQTPK